MLLIDIWWLELQGKPWRFCKIFPNTLRLASKLYKKRWAIYLVDALNVAFQFSDFNCNHFYYKNGYFSFCYFYKRPGRCTTRKRFSSAGSAARRSSGRRRCRLTCSFTRTRGRILASIAVKDSTRNPTWKSTPTSTLVRSLASSFY